MTISVLGSGVYRASMMERVHWGRPAGQVLKEELAARNAQRVMVVTNRSLLNSSALASILDPLAPQIAAVFSNVTAHSPRSSVIEGAQEARRCDADLIVA